MSPLRDIDETFFFIYSFDTYLILQSFINERHLLCTVFVSLLIIKVIMIKAGILHIVRGCFLILLLHTFFFLL